MHSYGATEVFPPEDADCIVDNMATGETLRANGLVVVDELMRSSTRLYANAHALEREAKRERIERLVLLLRSVLDARQRVMLEVNVPADRLEAAARQPGFRGEGRGAAARSAQGDPGDQGARRHRHRGHSTRPDRAMRALP